MNELVKAAASVQAPAYLFSEALFEQRAMEVKEAFGPAVDLCFSIKANPFLLGILPKAFSKIEVCSPGELRICEKMHMPMDMVIFSGVNKSEADIERAFHDHVGVMTAESRRHLEMINARGLKEGAVIPVLLRVTGGSQFGMDESDVLDIIRSRNAYPGVVITGLHYFTGTQKRKAKPILKELDYLGELTDRIRETLDFEILNLEYGTGLAVDYFKEDADALEHERLTDIAEAIRQLGEKAHLTVEMGRFFAAPCGVYTTRVVDTKTNMGINYAILDGGLHQLKYDGQIQGMQIPEITHIRSEAARETEAGKWTLCGSLCTTADVLARDASFTDLQVGDLLVFHRTGAYSVMEGMAVFLSRDMPAVYLLGKDGSPVLVRKAGDTWQMNTSAE